MCFHLEELIFLPHILEGIMCPIGWINYITLCKTPNSIFKFYGDNNTVIKINQGAIYSQNTPSQNYPKKI